MVTRAAASLWLVLTVLGCDDAPVSIADASSAADASSPPTTTDADAMATPMTDAGLDAAHADAGPIIPDVLECGGKRCEGAILGEVFVAAPCCYDDRLCGLRIVESPVPVTDACIGWTEEADPNTDCAAAEPSGRVYDYGCCLPDGTCGARFAQPDRPVWCVDATSIGLASGATCDPTRSCGLPDAACTSEDDCCGFPPDGTTCGKWNDSPGTCAMRCGKDFECATGCCRTTDDGIGACAPADVCQP